MKKNSKKGYVILSILFILVSIIVFAIPSVKTIAFWISYVFTVIAFIVQIIIWKSTFGDVNSLKSKFLGFSTVYIGFVYLAIQIIILTIFLLVPALPSWSAIAACTLIAGISTVCMIASDMGRGEIEQVSAKTSEKTFYIKKLKADIEMLANAEIDTTTKEDLRRLAEKIRFSDPMSSNRLADLENKIYDKVVELQTVENKEAIIIELDSLLDERNKKCKILK